MKYNAHYVIIPAIVPALFAIAAAIPVELVGCRNRGLMVGLIALIGALAGLGSVVVGAIRRFRGDPSANLWVLSTLILIIPAVVIVAMEL